MTDRRISQSDVAGNLAAAIVRAGTNASTLSKATGIPAGDLQCFLNGSGDMQVDQLVKAGGFLHLSPSDLIGVAA